MLCQVIHSGVKQKAKRDNNLHNNPRLPHQLTLGIGTYRFSGEDTNAPETVVRYLRNYPIRRYWEIGSRFDK